MTDDNFHEQMRVRAFFHYAMKSQNPKEETVRRFEELTGLCPKGLYLRLWSQMQPGMTWENYGEWHIDHVKPCCAFDFTWEGQARECFDYRNLRPLWKRDNLDKIRDDKRQRLQTTSALLNFTAPRVREASSASL